MGDGLYISRFLLRALARPAESLESQVIVENGGNKEEHKSNH
jgi:hypothetical protein